MADQLTTGIQKMAAELSKSNLEARLAQAEQIKVAKEQLEASEKAMKESGLEAKDSQAYRDEELRIKKAELALRKQGATSKAAKEEIAKEEASLQENRFEKFFGQNSYVGGALGKLGSKLDSLVPGGAKGVLSALGTVAALGALITFLESETWQKLKGEIIPALSSALSATFGAISEFASDFMAFAKNPSWENLKEIFTGDSSKFLLGLAAITALMNPLKSLKLLRLGVRGLVAAASSFGKGLSRASGGLGGNVDAQGRQLTKNKAGKFVVAPGQKGAGQFSKSIPKSTFLKGLGRGILAGGKLIPGVGLAVTAAVGIYDGLSAGITEYKESGDLGKSVEAGLAGAASGLTFGLVSQETFQKGIDGIQSSISGAWSATTNAFSKFKTAVSTELTSENITKKMDSAIASVNSGITLVSTKFEEFTGFELPDIKLPTTEEMKVKFDSFVTDLKSLKMPTLDDVKTGFTNFAEKVKNLKMPTLDDVKTSFTNFQEKVKKFELPSMDDFGKAMTDFKTSAENMTGLKLPDFSDVKKMVEDKLGFKASDIKLPEIPDLGAIISDAFQSILRGVLEPIVNFTAPFIGGQPIRFAMSKFSAGQNLLDFIDKTGNYAPKPPRTSDQLTPTDYSAIFAGGRGGSTVVVNSSSASSGDTVVTSSKVEGDPYVMSIAGAQ